MKATVKMAMKAWEWAYGFVGGIQASITNAVGRWRTNAAIKKAVEAGKFHVSELDYMALRTFSCLTDSLETKTVYMSPEFSGSPQLFMSKVLEGIKNEPREFSYSNRPWILLCLAEHWSADCWGLYKDLGARAPKVFFAKQDGTWGVDGHQEWRNSLQPVEFEHMSEFALKVRAGFPNMKDVGWDEI